MKSKWAIVRDYVNSKEVGSILTRKQMKLDLPEVYLGTIDCERIQLTDSGFLKIVAAGRYELVKKIPEGLTTTELWLLKKGDTLQYLERVSARKERDKIKGRVRYEGMENIRAYK